MSVEAEEISTGSSVAKPGAFSIMHPLRLAYFVSHPIQYQAPLLRRLAREKDIDLRVFFSSNHFSPRVHRSWLRGFGEVGHPVCWRGTSTNFCRCSGTQSNSGLGSR